MRKLKVKNPVFKKAGEALHVLSKDKQARIEYDRRQATLYFYEKTMANRFAEGKAEGSYQSKLEIARQMKSKGFPVSDVVEMTGLTSEEVERL